MSATTRFLTCAVFTLLVGGCATPDDEAGKEPGPLEGKWKLTLRASGGKAGQEVIAKELSLFWQLCPTEEILDDRKRVRGFTEYLLTIAGDKMAVKSIREKEEKAIFTARFRADAQEPLEIDIMEGTGQGKTVTRRGIYWLKEDGKRMYWAIGVGQRPVKKKMIESPDGYVQLGWERQKQ